MRLVKRARIHMANNPKKVKDPTEVALSAIQEALNISETSAESNRTAQRDEVSPPIPPTASSYNEPSFEARPRTEMPASEEPRQTVPARRPANDDRETIGQILQAIQKGRPARNVYTLATLFGCVWLIGCTLLTIAFLPSLKASIGEGSGGVL